MATDAATLRPAEGPADVAGLWRVMQEIIAHGTTYVHDVTTREEDFREYWFGRGGEQWIFELDGIVVGGYTLRPNHPGRGSHIATASYIVAEAARGAGLGRRLAAHSIEAAGRLGFKGIQFNLVVSTNRYAVKLWKDLGFAVVGTLPGAFRHATEGDVDAFVMFLPLE